MSLLLLTRILCVSVLTGQMVMLDHETVTMQPLGGNELLLISSPHFIISDTIFVSRLDSTGASIWTSTLDLNRLSYAKPRDATIIVMGYQGNSCDYQFLVYEIDRDNGELVSTHIYDDSDIGFTARCIELSDGQFRLFSGDILYSLDLEWELTQLATIPEINLVNGASLMTDGCIEIAGSVNHELLWLIWMTADGLLIDITEPVEVYVCNYSEQPGFMAILLTMNLWPGPHNATLKLRSVVSPPGEHLFSVHTNSLNTCECVTEDGYLILVDKLSSNTLLVQKFDQSGYVEWASENEIPLGEYRHIESVDIVPVCNGYAFAGCFSGSRLERQFFILFLDDQGRVMVPESPSDYLDVCIIPNPFRESALLTANLEVYGTLSADIYDLSGRLIQSLGPITDTGEISLPIENMLSGVFVVCVRFNSIDGYSIFKTMKIVHISP